MIITCPECRTRYRYGEGEHAEPFQCQCSKCMSTFVSAEATRPYLVVSKVECHPVGDTPAGVVPATIDQPRPEEEFDASPAVPDVPYDDEPEEASGGFSIGMDDPNLAASLEKTALNTENPGDIGMPMTYSVKAEDEPVVEPAPDEPVPAREELQHAVHDPETETAPEIYMSLDLTDQPDTMGDGEPVVEEEVYTYHDSEMPAEPEQADVAQVEVESPAEEPAVTEPTTGRAVPGFGAFLFITLLTSVGAVGGWQLSIILGQDPMLLAPSSGLVGLLVGWLWLRWKFFTK